MKKSQPEANDLNDLAVSTPPEKAAEAKAGRRAADSGAQEPVFTIEQLRRDALTLFGVSTSTYDGATHGMSGSYTVKAMAEHIDKWLKEEY